MDVVEDFIVVKATCDGKTRRLTLKRSAALALPELQTQVRSLFHLSDSASLSLTYSDSEGDRILLEDDRDLRDALLLQRLNPLRLQVIVAEEPQPEGDSNGVADAPAAEESQEEESPAPAVQPERVVVHLRSGKGVELREDHRATDLLLAVTAEKVAAVVEAALRNRSSLYLEIAFPPETGPDQSAPGAEAQPNGAAVGNGLAIVPPGHPSAAVAGSRGASLVGPAAQQACFHCGLVGVPGPRYTSVLHPDREICAACFSSRNSSDSKLVLKPPASSPRSLPPSWTSPPHASKRGALSAAVPPLSVLPASGSVPHSLALQEGAAEEAEALLRTPGAAGLVHEGIECDGCRMCPIVGPRYKAKKLHDFDLCRKCYMVEGDRSAFDEIVVPVLPSPHP